MLEALLHLFRTVLLTGEVPETWKQTIFNMLAPPGGFARAGTRSSVTTCDVYPQPFVVLVVWVFIFIVFFHI